MPYTLHTVGDDYALTSSNAVYLPNSGTYFIEIKVDLPNLTTKGEFFRVSGNFQAFNTVRGGTRFDSSYEIQCHNVYIRTSSNTVVTGRPVIIRVEVNLDTAEGWLRVFEEDGHTLIDEAVGTGLSSIDSDWENGLELRYGNTSATQETYLHYINLNDQYYYDPNLSRGTGNTLQERKAGESAAFTNFPTDDSQWVWYKDKVPLPVKFPLDLTEPLPKAIAEYLAAVNVSDTPPLVLPTPALKGNTPPTYPVEIDWSNPITRGLDVAILPSLTQQHNLATGDAPWYDGTAGGDGRFKIGSELMVLPKQHGLAWEFDSVGDVQRRMLPEDLDFTTNARAVFTVFQPAANNQDHGLLDVGDQLLLFWLDWNNTNNLRVAAYAGGAVYGTNFSDPLDKHTCAWSAVRSGTTTYIDMYADDTVTRIKNTSIGAGGDWTTRNNFSIGRNYSSTSKAAFGDMYIYLSWSRPLEEAEYDSLYANPYQIFKPATPKPLTVPGAAGGGGPATQDISPTFITSNEVVYNPAVNPGAVTVAPNFITSDEVVYNPTVTPQQFISPTFITSNEVVYNPSVGQATFVYPEFITSDETLYNPTIGVGAVDITSPTFITSGEVLYNPALSTTVDISPNFITSDESLYQPSIEVEKIIYPSFIASAEDVYRPSLTGGSVVEIPAHWRLSFWHVGTYLTRIAGYNLTIHDAIHAWLKDQGATGRDINDMMFDYLGGKGYTGTMPDRFNQWRNDP